MVSASASGGTAIDFASHQCTPSKWQIDGGAVPILEADEAAGRHRERHDRSPGFPRQHDDAEARGTRAFRHVRGQRDVIVFFERAHHFLEGADAALAVKRRPVVAGAADGADAEPFGGDRVEFAVAMPGNQHLGAMALLGPDEGRHEMLAVPERENRRLLRLDQVIDVGRVEAERVGPPHQPQEFGREKPGSALHPAAAQRVAKQSFQRPGFAS